MCRDKAKHAVSECNHAINSVAFTKRAVVEYFAIKLTIGCQIEHGMSFVPVICSQEYELKFLEKNLKFKF